jgi:dihydropteroate synthase
MTSGQNIAQSNIFNWEKCNTQPRIMGILNLTPDSFFEGSRLNLQKLLDKAGMMIDEGVDILDIGGYSSRPGATDISVSEELSRVVPAIEKLRSVFPDILLSVDTFRGEVADAALQAGCNIINDISAWQIDPLLYDVLEKWKPAYVLMHMRGNPQNMQTLTDYDDIVNEVLAFFQDKIKALNQIGLHDLALDPGIGFAKTVDQNFELIKRLGVIHKFNTPILAGISRKSLIWKTLGTTADFALNGTTALHMAALMNGARILRVHDVKDAVECVTLWQKIRTH